MSDTHHFRFVYQNVDGELGERILEFWTTHKALPANVNSRHRLDEIVVVAECDDRVIGVSTVVPLHYPRLKLRLFNFRCFVDPDYRRDKVAAEMLNLTYESLNQRFSEGTDPSVVGLMAVAQNPGLRLQHNHAVWPNTGLVFIGYDANGFPMRLKYFDEARIET